MDGLTVMEYAAILEFIENNDVVHFADVCEDGSVDANELLIKLASLAGKE